MQGDCRLQLHVGCIAKLARGLRTCNAICSMCLYFFTIELFINKTTTLSPLRLNRQIQTARLATQPRTPTPAGNYGNWKLELELAFAWPGWPSAKETKKNQTHTQAHEQEPQRRDTRYMIIIS